MINDRNLNRLNNPRKYESEKYLDKVSGGKKIHNLDYKNKYDDDLDIDDFEKEKPDLVAQCRQILPKL